MPVVDLLGGGNLEGDYPSQERQQRVLRPTNGCPSDNDKNRRIVNLEERASKTPTIQSDEGYQEVKKVGCAGP